MAEGEIEQFATTFKRFMDAMVARAGLPRSPLMNRIRDHLGAEPTRLPVVVEEFDPFEQPNLQRALDDYVAGDGRQTNLVGVAAENKRFVAVGLSDLLGRGGSFLAEARSTTSTTPWPAVNGSREAAMDELAEGGRLAERILGRTPGAPESQPPVRPGFPQAWRRG